MGKPILKKFVSKSSSSKDVAPLVPVTTPKKKEETYKKKGNPFSDLSKEDLLKTAQEKLDESKAYITDIDDDEEAGYNFGDFAPDDYDNLIGDLLAQAGEASQKNINERDIRRNVLSNFRDEIDATNVIYDDLLNREDKRGESRLGSNRALQNASGLLGSGRGAGMTEEVYDTNADNEAAIQAARAQKLSVIQSSARAEAQAEIAAEKLAKQQGADAYLELMKTQDDRSNARVDTLVDYLVNNEIDPEELSEKEKAELTRNLRVPYSKIQNAYMTATKATREANKEAEMKSTREAAIVGVYAQLPKDSKGRVNPQDIFDLVNYTEDGTRVGDITLTEIKAITDSLYQEPDEPEYFNLGEGQSRYRVNPDGTVDVIASKAKTYAPARGRSGGSGGSGGSSGGGGNYTFEQYLAEKVKENGGKAFSAQGIEYLRETFNNMVQKGEISTAPLSNLTSTNKRDLGQAGLTESDSRAQSYFLGSESGFRSYFTRQVATGAIPRGASLDEIDAAYQEWSASQDAEGEDDLDALLNALTE